MKTFISTLVLSCVCLASHASGNYLEKPQEVRVRQNNSCSLQDFSSREDAEQYTAKHGGEVFRDQDTHVYRAVKCKFGISERVMVVSGMNDG